MTNLLQRARLELWSVERLLKTIGILAPPVDPCEVAKHLGVIVLPHPNREWSGGIDILNRNNPADNTDNAGTDQITIWFNPIDGPLRQRLVIAHELGHVILHQDTVFRCDALRGSQHEDEANRFATELLMPRWMLGPLQVHGPEALAQAFGVSPRAMLARLVEIHARPVRPTK